MRGDAAPWRALLALGLGLVVLTGAGGTGASWAEHDARKPGTITSGGLSLTTGALRTELHSQQPFGSRTYASSTTCAPDPGYVECRVISATLTSEALVPGDRVVIAQPVTLAASGTTLRGTLAVSSTALTSAARSAFSGSATTTTTITAPGGAVTTGSSASIPVSVSTGTGVGTSTVRISISTPVTASTGGWGSALQDQSLLGGTFTYTFAQTRA